MKSYATSQKKHRNSEVVFLTITFALLSAGLLFLSQGPELKLVTSIVLVPLGLGLWRMYTRREL